MKIFPKKPILKKFIGGQALALYISNERVATRRHAFRSGKQSGHDDWPVDRQRLYAGGTKMTAVYLSPLTNTELGRGATSGYWGTYLKAAATTALSFKARR
jgi:aldehyde:ferredoxin oxidoreductase